MELYDYLIADTFEGTMSRLEAFSDASDRLAITQEQRELAADFQKFVGFVTDFMSGNPRLVSSSESPREISERDHRDFDLER